jgi:hypothetical protein
MKVNALDIEPSCYPCKRFGWPNPTIQRRQHQPHWGQTLYFTFRSNFSLNPNFFPYILSLLCLLGNVQQKSFIHLRPNLLPV